MGTSLGANAALEVAASAPRAPARAGHRDARARQRPARGARLTFTPLLVALTFGEPVMKLVARATRAVPRRAAAALRQRACSTSCARSPAPAARCCRGSSSGASRRRAASARRSRRRRSCSATGATRCIPSPTPACSPRRCPTRACSRPTRWSSCACSPERLTDEIAAFLDEVWAHGGARQRRQRAKRASRPVSCGERQLESRRRATCPGAEASSPTADVPGAWRPSDPRACIEASNVPCPSHAA